MATLIKIFHIASMARSGETLVLKTLSQHPALKIVHNLNEKDQDYELAMFQFLKEYSKTNIEFDHHLVAPYNMKAGQSFVVKQGAWQHRFPFNGFVLSRNPLAIYASLRVYDSSNGKTPDENWPLNQRRLTRWLRDICPATADAIKERKPIEQFAIFYNRRMGQLLKRGLPIVRYEELVSEPVEQFRKICKILAVDFDETILNAHRTHAMGVIGHGKNDLSQPINRASIDKYKKLLSKTEQAELWAHVSKTALQYGYSADPSN